MSKKKTYRVVCPELDLVLFVKGYSLNEEQKLYESLRSKILKEDKSIKIEDYKTFIVRKFLIDVEGFFDLLDTDDIEEMNEGVDAAYNAIVGLYPPFALEFICTDLNTDTFMSGVERRFLKHIKDQIQTKADQGGSVALSGIEDINNLEDYFKEHIIGQRPALDAIVKSLKLMASGLSGHSSFLFVGPTGVGKTQVGKLLGERFSGNFYKINCAEYAGGHEYAKLIGSPPGYVGHSEKSLLAEKAEQSNSWVFLFDEIEKAHHKLYDFLLSLLDDGTCTDNMGQVLDFSQSIFIFTSNQGVTDINRNPMGFDRSEEIEQNVTDSIIRKSVKKHFSPEFLNRIDDIVVFNSLSKAEVREIAQLQLEDLPIKATDPLIDFIVDNGFSAEYGARNIARFIKNNISDKIADAILNKLVPKKDGAYYTPRIVKGEVKIINTQKYNVSSS
jgi:ATP-dependent Clp protease ATP-binding subunit ClpA